MTIILALCLLVSLCFNMLAGGAWLAGRWLDRRLGSSIEQVMQIYPPEIRRDVLRRLIADRRELMTKVKDLRDARQRMFTVMRADALDPQALSASMADVRDKTAALQSLLQSELAASLAGTPAAERQKITPPLYGLDLLLGGDSSPSP